MSVDSLEFGDCAVVSRSKLFPATSVVLSLRGGSRDVENMIGGCVTHIAPSSRFLSVSPCRFYPISSSSLTQLHMKYSPMSTSQSFYCVSLIFV